MVKNPSANAGDTRDAGLIPRLGRSLVVKNGNSLQYSYLENSMDRDTWWATVHRVAKSWTWLSYFTSLHFMQNLEKEELMSPGLYRLCHLFIHSFIQICIQQIYIECLCTRHGDRRWNVWVNNSQRLSPPLLKVRGVVVLGQTANCGHHQQVKDLVC